jgi:hypothetical protein
MGDMDPGTPPRNTAGKCERTKSRAFHGLAVAVATAVAAGTVLAGLAVADPVPDVQQVVQQVAPVQDAQQTAQQIAKDPGTANNNGADTKYTPVYQSIATAAAVGWRQVGGAVYPGNESAAGDPKGMNYQDTGSISHTVDFFSVAFAPDNPDRGFAAGAACKDPNTPESGLASCPRVPVIFSYTKADGWREIYRGDDQRGDGHGFVGAIAWLPDGETAVAVGGDGCYPRREVYCDAANQPPSQATDRIAGDALAWIYRGGRWEPLTDLPPGMTGLTALDFSSRPSDCGASVECGLAGGLGQVWMWTDDERFHPSYQSPVTEFPVKDVGAPPPDPCTGPASPECQDEPFRIRGVKFSPTTSFGLKAVAVTSGCCYRYRVHDPQSGSDREVTDPTNRYPRLMALYQGEMKWHVGGLSIYGRNQDPRLQTIPDSLYSVRFSGGGLSAGQISAIAAPGGDEQPIEPGARVIGPIPISTSPERAGAVGLRPETDLANTSGGANGGGELGSPQLSSVRLVAGDGDLDHMAYTGVAQLVDEGFGSPGPDGVIDWAVGEHADQAVAYLTAGSTANTQHVPNPISCPGGAPVKNLSAQCGLAQDVPQQAKSDYLFSLPSYPLNAFTAVGQTGIAWAAGDHGALLTLGGAGQAGKITGASNPPKLGGGQLSRLSSREAYDGFRPALNTEPGVVPALDGQPFADSPVGRLVSGGSPDPHPGRPWSVGAIAMSRDGSEGWAVGAAATLYHFDGVRWASCDATGIAGLVSPDPACARLASLSLAGGRIVTVARVPLERGSDQSKAEDFEAVAVALNGSTPEFLRYRRGTWDVVPEWTNQLQAAGANVGDGDIAFSTPEDGWLIARNGSAGQDLYHLTDGQWVKCDSGHFQTSCKDPNAFLPTSATIGNNPDYAFGGFASGLHLLSVGQRVYLYGTRAVRQSQPRYPVVLSYEPGRNWKQEFDPDPQHGSVGGDATHQGILNSLALVQDANGSVSGWGIGEFEATDTGEFRVPDPTNSRTPLLRLDDKGWHYVTNADPAAVEYLLPPDINQQGTRGGREQVIALPGPDGKGPVIAIPQEGGRSPPLVWLNPATDRWEGFPVAVSGENIDAAVPDNRGGLWLATEPAHSQGVWFYHYTRHVSNPVFTDVPQPIREPITATAAGGDGSFWATTTSGNVYRYDRLTGWDQVAVRGWDLGGAVKAPAYAIAVGNDGSGLVVGKQGRIADISPQGAVLDQAAVLCSSRPDACGNGRTLRAAAIAPDDGSALVGGDSRALVWRPPGGSFATTTPPQMSPSATITGISMPGGGRAWLSTDTGDVFAGSLGADGWQWTRENVDSHGKGLSTDQAVQAIAVDGGGHGYAVGDHGLVLQRTGDGPQPWRRLATGYGENLRSITLGPGGKGALIGGDAGLVLTLVNGRFEVARSSDILDPFSASASFEQIGTVVGVALLPGYKSGDVEAWAAIQGTHSTPPPGTILHYTNDPSNPLLAAGTSRAQPLPDAPAHDPGHELDFAAFGKSDCVSPSGAVCPEFTGSERQNEVIARGIRDTLLSKDHRPDVAIFTGDVNDAAGSSNGNIVSGPTEPSRIHQRWSEQIAGPLSRADAPVYAALGGQDLSNTQVCSPVSLAGIPCPATHQTRTGLNLAWRQAFAQADKPWGSGDPTSAQGLTFEPVSTGDQVADPNAAAGQTGLPIGGAHTHYAVDIKRADKKLVRLVVVDTSLKTLAGTGGVQNPVEDQLKWLHDVLTSAGRGSDEQAVVVSETPSYTYGSTGAGTDTLLDSAAFEALMVKDNVSAVISGRMGWNGLYWLLAPGLHYPCPGGAYSPGPPPNDPTQLCENGGAALNAADDVAKTLQGLGAPVPTPSDKVHELAGSLSAVPFAVAASAGGQFGPDGSGSGTASQGFWHGYSLVRLFTDGNIPLVEQRPVFDWIGIRAKDHVLTPGGRMALQGFGREPVASDQPARYDDIDSPAITHRYDLVLADPEKPYLPKVDPTSDKEHHYVAVPPDVGASIDRQTGEIKYSGSGNHPPVYALGILSVDDRTATWPVVLAPRRSFVLSPPPLQRLVLPPLPRVVASAPASLPPPPAAQIPNPPQLNLTFPSPPSLPNLSLNAPQARPPAPPAPPPPPASPAASALQITPAPVGLNVAPPATVIPPPAPPIQPAPPSGARREARQRQAAVAKSEEGGSPESATEESQNGAGGSDTQAASTRLQQRRDDLAFTALRHEGQPSAWPRDLLFGGGLGIAALAMALGWSMLRPRPRRREPDLPAPAWARWRNGRP